MQKKPVLSASEQQDSRETLLEIARVLSATLTPEQVADAVVGTLHEALGASASLFYLNHEGCETPRVVASRGVLAAGLRALRWQPANAALPATDCLMQANPIWVSSADELHLRYPVLLESGLTAQPIQSLMTLPLRQHGRNLGCVSYAFSSAAALDATSRAFAMMLAEQSALALERALLLAAHARARERAQLLAAVSSTLAASLDIQHTLERMAALLIGSFADWVAVDLRAPSGRLEHFVLRHRDPEQLAEAQRLEALPLESSAPPELVVRTGKSQWHPHLAEPTEGFADGASDECLRALGRHSEIVVPFRANSQIVGVLWCVLQNSAYTREDLAFAEEVAAVAASALERARLYATSRREEERLRMALEAGQMRAWEWNLRSNQLRWTPVASPEPEAACAPESTRYEALEKRNLDPAAEAQPSASLARCFTALQLDMHADDRKPFETEIARALEARAPFEVSFRSLQADGSVSWFEMRGSFVRGRAGDSPRLIGVTSDISARRRGEQALAERERKFRAVFDSARDAMVLADDARVLFDVNPAACELLGYSRSEMLGRKPQDFIISEAEQGASLWRNFRDLGDQRGEIVLRRRDGSKVAVEYTASADVYPGAHLAIWRDIERRKRAEHLQQFLADAGNELARSLDYEATLTAVAELAVPAFADWAVVDMLDNAGNLRRVALSHHDAQRARSARAVFAGNTLQLGAASSILRVLRTRTAELIASLDDEDLQARSGDARQLEWLRSLGLESALCVPLIVRGRALGVISFASAESRRRFDGSDLALAEELARRASIALENATILREAQDANRLKDEFLGTVSHELRTPLNAILGWVTLLRSNQGNATMTQRGVDVIERNARAQSRLIDDVLDVSRIISGKLRLQCVSVDLGAVVRAALEAVAPAAKAKAVTLQELELEPVALLGDADRLQQVVWNLLSNAVKFTPAGGLVTVQTLSFDDAVVVQVADTGQGVAPEFLPYLFDRFRQADSSPSRRHEGLGLGLAIAKNLVELHGGSISAQSAGPERGSTFSVRLPAKPAAVAAKLDAPAPAVAPQLLAARLDGVRVLVCDDHEDAREVVSSVLAACGAEVRAVSSADEALGSLADFGPQVLVSDLGMPERDGFSLIRELRTRPGSAGGQVPAIALTAYVRVEDSARARSAGFDLHLPKPVDGPKLVLAVARLATDCRHKLRTLP